MAPPDGGKGGRTAGQRSRVRQVVLIAALPVLFVTAFGVPGVLQRIRIGTAYKAKMLCSEVFISRRDADVVSAELAVDDLTSLRFIEPSIDRNRRTVTASLLGLFENTARHRRETGCTLHLEESAQERAEDTESQRADQGLSDETPEAFDDGPVDPPSPALANILEAAFREPDPRRLARTRAIVVLRDGRIVGERYAPGFGSATPILGWSLTKSVMNALVGVLVKRGTLSRETRIQTDIWEHGDDPRRRIDVDDLLRMSSGLAFSENMSDALADPIRMLLLEPDMAAFAASKPFRNEPGRRWHYTSGDTNILSAFLRRVLGDAAYRRFPRDALFKPLGLRQAVLETDASGTFVGSSSMYATARDWTRIGQLYLQDGVWSGRRILPVGWVRYSRTPAPSDPKRRYGAGFWLSIPASYGGADGDLPPDVYHAVGHEGQFISIVPSRTIVIVRLGKTRYPGAWNHARFVRNVLSALTP